MTFILGFLLGFLSFLAYFIWRMLRSDGWDSSNMTNAIRLLSHVALHPEDFGKMFYLEEVPRDSIGATPAQVGNSRIVFLKRPFHYVDKDELSEVVNSRPEDIEDGEEEVGLHRRRRHGLR